MATALISQIHQVSLLKSAVTGGDGVGGQERSCAGLLGLRSRPAGARRTRSPASACRASRTARAGGVRRQPDHVVRHVGDDDGQRDRARVGATRERCRRRRRRRPRPCRRRCGRPARLAVPARNGSPDCSATGVEQLVPGGEHGRARRDGRRLGGGHGRARRRARRPSRPAGRARRARRRASAARASTPSASASRSSTRWSAMRVRDERLRERARAALPRDERARLLGRRRDRAARRPRGR